MKFLKQPSNMENYKTTVYSPENFEPSLLETDFPNDLVETLLKTTDGLLFISKGNYETKKMYYPKKDKIIIGVFSENKLTPFRITLEKIKDD